MFRNAARRLGLTAMVVLSLVFSQLALAAYLCPAASGQEQALMEMAPGEPCGGMDMSMDTAQPVLCHHHCTQAPQSPDAVKLPVVSLPAIVQVRVLPLAPDRGVLQSRASFGSGEPQSPPEPVFLSTLRLRV